MLESLSAKSERGCKMLSVQYAELYDIHLDNKHGATGDDDDPDQNYLSRLSEARNSCLLFPAHTRCYAM